MKTTIDPGTKKPGINVIGPVVYSHGVPSLTQGTTDLSMTFIMPGQPPREVMADPNVEFEGSEAQGLPKLPTILWIPGGGWRGQSRDQMLCELGYFCEHGYVVACIDYRTSAQAKFPAQIEDVKTAIRFLRAKGAPYWVDPDRIAAMGRSAGGHLTSIAAMGLDGQDTEEWSGFSSRIQCGVDLFGPVHLARQLERTQGLIRQPGFRWNRIEQSHEFALLGSVDPEVVRAADPSAMVHPGMAPLLIMHGTQDPLVPWEYSEQFYEQINRVCGEGHAQLYFLKGAGHGTDEFWQTETKEIILHYLDETLKG